jgi:hypothetical protein
MLFSEEFVRAEIRYRSERLRTLAGSERKTEMLWVTTPKAIDAILEQRIRTGTGRAR